MKTIGIIAALLITFNGQVLANTFDVNKTDKSCSTIVDSIGCEPMSTEDFDKVFTTIGEKSFGDSKMKLAKEASSNNCLTAEQIAEILGAFDFESSRLEYAKYAYSSCYDQNNYYKVNDVFDFEGSIEELDTYIQTKK